MVRPTPAQQTAPYALIAIGLALLISMAYSLYYEAKYGIPSPIRLYNTPDCNTTNYPAPHTTLVELTYFFVVTITTVGYGDLKPCTETLQWGTLIMILSCAILFACFISYVEKMLASVEVFLARRYHNYPRFVHPRMPESIRPTVKINLSVMVIFLANFIGTISGIVFEKLDFHEAVYFAVVTTSTVGYGDYSFKSYKGKLFAISWLVISTVAVAMSYTYICQATLRAVRKKTLQAVLDKTFGRLEFAGFQRKDRPFEPTMSVAHYQIYILQQAKLVDRQVLHRIRTKFLTLADETNQLIHFNRLPRNDDA